MPWSHYLSVVFYLSVVSAVPSRGQQNDLVQLSMACDQQEDGIAETIRKDGAAEPTGLWGLNHVVGYTWQAS
jgi:hypothetical protein